MKNQKVIVLDFGGQYNQLIARRVRECNVYCEVLPYTTPIEKLKAENPIGIIFTGGPGSVYLENAPHYDPAIFEMGVPILGICYGCQLMAHTLGGQVTEAQDDSAREYGKTLTYYDTSCKLFKDLPAEGISWMSHGDYMAKVPEGFKLTAHSDACPNVAIADEARGFYGVQYHPEVNHTENGIKMIRNFLYEVCGATGDWTMGDYLKTAVNQIREKVGDGKVLLALSGGVDSSVAAALLAKAVGPQLTCIFVDHGLLRKNEGDEVASIFGNMDINFGNAIKAFAISVKSNIMESGIIAANMGNREREDLVLVTREYLLPYLRFIRDNKKVYRAAFRNPNSMGANARYGELKQHIFGPVLKRFEIPAAHRPYYIAYYIEGIAALVKEWLQQDCGDKAEMIADIIESCVRPKEGSRSAKSPVSQ